MNDFHEQLQFHEISLMKKMRNEFRTRGNRRRAHGRVNSTDIRKFKAIK